MYSPKTFTHLKIGQVVLDVFCRCLAFSAHALFTQKLMQPNKLSMWQRMSQIMTTHALLYTV